MRFQNKILLSVFCLFLMGFVFMPFEDTAHAQTDWCCNNNQPDPQDGFCVPSPQMEQNCNGANQTFFEDGVDGITLAPVCIGPQCPTSGDLCPNPAQLRTECLCVDSNQQVVPCQTLIPTPTPTPIPTPTPTPVPTPTPTPTPIPTGTPPPTGVPTPTPTATPTPTPVPTGTPQPPGTGCCVEAVGLCSITAPESCSVPPNLDFLGIGTNCDDVEACNVPPPPVSEVPTMNEWGLIFTALMIGLFSLIAVRRGFRFNDK